MLVVSGEQWRDSAIHMHVSILPQTPLPSRHASILYLTLLVTVWVRGGENKNTLYKTPGAPLLPALPSLLSYTLPCVCPDVSILFLKHAKWALASGLIHLLVLFPLLECTPKCPHALLSWLFTFFPQIFLPQRGFPDHPTDKNFPVFVPFSGCTFLFIGLFPRVSTASLIFACLFLISSTKM